MRKNLAFTFLLLALSLFGFGSALIIHANPTIQQTQTQGPCPTYHTNLEVDLVNSVPINSAIGQTVITTFHVIYPDGTPATLNPERASFLWGGPSGQTEFDNVLVVFTGNAGFYNYTQQITDDLVKATGQGTVIVSVVACSCQDIQGNRGPTSLTSSNTTLTPSDNSNEVIGPQTPTTQPILGSNLLVPLIIIILLIIATLLALRRRGKKKT